MAASAVSLNAFLRKLPELVVDNLTFVRDCRWTEYHLSNGAYKLHKVGYNCYAVERVPYSTNNYHAEWDSSKGCGDVFITGLVPGLIGKVSVILGDDVPDCEEE